MRRVNRVVLLMVLLGLASCDRKENGPPAVPMQIGKKPDAKTSDKGTSATDKAKEKTPEQLCQEFAALKKANDPKANELLGREPKVPAQPITANEAEALQTDFYLHGKIRITSVNADVNKPQHFILKTEGALGAPRIPVIGEGSQTRNMSNMTVVVEVRDGKIYGVRSDL